jgi:hypothetical protein
VARKAISNQNVGGKLRIMIYAHPIGNVIIHMPLQVDRNIHASTVARIASQNIVAIRRNVITNQEKKEKLNKCSVSMKQH